MMETMIKKLLMIFGRNKMYRLSLKTLTAMFPKNNELFYTQNIGNNLWPSYNIEPNSFYLKCIELLKDELRKYLKLVWSMSLQDIVSLFEFFNCIEQSKNLKTEVSELY